ncbi:unnamed protein product [Orchesella dallaii]|uniref:F-box domain-containing protein n=1 Tax=Orchesella dallaii TaxID=48710 RepID=A0ABP1R1V1_9HEXA
MAEVWEKIFDNVNNPADMLNAANASPTWRKFIYEYKPAAFFPMILPLVLEHTAQPSVLALREVNVDSRRIVDSALQQYCSHPEFELQFNPFWLPPTTELQRTVERIGRRCEINALEELYPYIDRNTDLYRLRGNAFLTGHLSLHIHGPRAFNGPLLGDEYSQIFSIYRTHLLSLAIWLSGLNPEQISTILAFVSTAQNLTTLRIASVNLHQHEVPMDVFQLPRLLHVESLDLSNYARGLWDQQLPILLPYIQGYGQNLKTFSCPSPLLSSPDITVEALNLSLPNLKCAKIVAIQTSSILKLSLVNWHLDRLHLHGSISSNGGVDFSLMDVIGLVNNFSGTLQTLDMLLQLTAPSVRCVERVPRDQMMKMEKLKVLRTLAENVKEEWFWDFVRFGCQNVVELRLKFPNLVSHFSTFNEECRLLALKGFRLAPKLKVIRFYLTFNQPPVSVRRSNWLAFAGEYDPLMWVELIQKRIQIRRGQRL